ncbi:hypothetical protein GCM10010215_71830 [Streptomyces virginiae]|uniref:Uncharacterized protein n=1 Tax=Streptomyces virginiae TaxID=1961 RepID=A0ABQ3NZG4_STRVG|nr:hypothetical protein GCM10010215_71830 [Streptomyces virginiae]GHI18164.1 hypothetical protein Scinn_76270 [Streptomyces virginiae]
MSVPDMYECPTAPRATHIAAKMAARVARNGAKDSNMAGTCSHDAPWLPPEAYPIMSM